MFPYYDIPPPPRLTKATFTFKMMRITNNFVTFQNVANHMHFIWKNYEENKNYFPLEGYGGGRGYLSTENSMKIIIKTLILPA